MKVITIGRSSDNNVTVNDPSVSRHHCQIIQHDNGSFTLSDFGSTNGTFVNGRQVHGEVPLNPNDIVKIGSAPLQWRNYFDDAAPIPKTSIVEPTQMPRTVVQPQTSSNKALPILLGVLGVLVVGVILVVVFIFNNDSSSSTSYVEEAPTVQTEVVKAPEATQVTIEEQKPEAPNISGEWIWESDDLMDFGGEQIPSMGFYLKIKQKEGETTFSGIYESFFGGDHTDIADNPVNGKWDGEKYVVNFESNAWGGKGKATIKQISSKKIEWKLVSHQGEVHTPTSATLTKK